MNTVSTKTNAAGLPARAHPDTTRHGAVFSLSFRKGGEGWGEEAGFIACPSLRRSEPSIRESWSPSPRPSPLGRGRNLRQLRAISTHPAIRLVLSANQPDAVTARCLSMRERVRVRGKVPTPTGQHISRTSRSSYAARRAQLSLRSTALSTASWPRRAIGRSE